MAYQKQTWINLPDKTTPISADRLNHMEDGIEAIDLDLENIDEHLTDYPKKTDYASANTGGTIKTGNAASVNGSGVIQADTKTYVEYGSGDNTLFISKGTLENVLTGKSFETTSNKVTSLSSSSTDTQYPSAKCVYNLVGDIETILETLDVGSGV